MMMEITPQKQPTVGCQVPTEQVHLYKEYTPILTGQRQTTQLAIQQIQHGQRILELILPGLLAQETAPTKIY